MKTRNLIFLILSSILLSSCLSVDIKHSDQRKRPPKQLHLANDVVITSWGAVEVVVLGNKTVLYPSSFRIESPDVVIYIDPLFIDEPKPADYIFITHAHEDHLSLSDINQLVKDNTLIIAPKKVVKKLPNFKTQMVTPGAQITLGEIKCETVPAYNLKPVFLWITPHSKKEMNVGYILTINGSRIYHAGDTDLIPELGHMTEINVAMVPIGDEDGGLTMDAEQAANLINKIEPEYVIPMHYEPGKEYVERFKHLVEDGIQVVMME